MLKSARTLFKAWMLVIALAAPLIGRPTVLAAQNAQPTRTILLAAKDDPYYPLAEEIARADGLVILHTLRDALSQNPLFLIWVVAPTHLSDRVIVDFSQTLQSEHSTVSIGIISGTTIEKARALWQRAAQARGENVFAVNGEYPAAQVLEGRITSFASPQSSAQSLTKESLIAVLRQADYVTFTGHGGTGYLSLAPKTPLTASDIPILPPLVIATASCQTFRPWRETSIALAFTDQGAAAYAGFAYSPNEGFLLGEFDGLPFRYTWRDFPIGHVVLLQNRGTLRGFAQFPHYFLLGDPRLALQTNPPYRLVEDRQDGDIRTLVHTAAPTGILPVRIPDGARYGFVEIPGIVSTGDDELFYNTRVQTANIGNDKYVLFDHTGGDFTVRLHLRAPWYWGAVSPLRDSLDGALLFEQQNGGDIFSLAIGLFAALLALWRLRRRQTSRAALPLAILAGLGFAVLYATYALLRLPNVTMNEKPIVFGARSLIGTFILTTSTTFLYLDAQSRRGRIIAVLLSILPMLTGAIILFILLSGINLLSAQTLGTGIYNYSLAWMCLIAAAFETLLFGTTFELMRRVRKK